MRTIVLIGCVKSVQEGKGSKKKPRNLLTHLMDVALASGQPKQAETKSIVLEMPKLRPKQKL